MWMGEKSSSDYAAREDCGMTCSVVTRAELLLAAEEIPVITGTPGAFIFGNPIEILARLATQSCSAKPRNRSIGIRLWFSAPPPQ